MLSDQATFNWYALLSSNEQHTPKSRFALYTRKTRIEKIKFKSEYDENQEKSGRHARKMKTDDKEEHKKP